MSNTTRKLVWVTGAPGTGKTTLGNAFKERKQWLHYDGDMFTHGGNPIVDTGIPTEEMLAKRDPELTRVYMAMVQNGYQAHVAGKNPPLSAFIPFHDVMCADVLRVWQSSNKSIIVTQPVYPKQVREYISSKIPNVEWIVLNDVANGAVERKVVQTKSAAAAENKTLSEFLAKFGKEWEGLDFVSCEEKLRNAVPTQKGHDMAQKGEHGIDIVKDFSADDVFEYACKILKI